MAEKSSAVTAEKLTSVKAEKLTAVKGMNDILPPDSARWEWLEQTVRGQMARYAYRKRADGSSTQQTSIAHPGRWTTVFRLGYLDLLRRAVADRGAVPAWLSQLVMYELGWLLRPWVRALSDTEPALVAVQLPEGRLPEARRMR